MKDDVDKAFSDIFPEEVLESIRKMARNKNININSDEIISQIIEFLRLTSSAKPALKQRIQRKLGFPILDKLLSEFSSPNKVNWEENIFSEQEMDKIRKAFYKSYPTLSKDELKRRKTMLQLSIYLLEQSDKFGPEIFPELNDYWDYLASLDWKIIKELFSDTTKLKTHLMAMKGDTSRFVHAREFANSLQEIKGIFHNLRFNKRVKNREDVLNYLIHPYLKLASFYEKFSRYALIDMRIVEGKYNSNKKNMTLKLRNIKDSFLSSENYKALGEINNTVRNSIAHSSYIIMEQMHRVRFNDEAVQEEYGYEELITMTKKLGILLYVIVGHSNRGYLLEFKLLSEMDAENGKTL